MRGLLVIPRVVEFSKERDVLLVNAEHSTVQLFENLTCFGILLDKTNPSTAKRIGFLLKKKPFFSKTP